jgi:pyruvate carboxylase
VLAAVEAGVDAFDAAMDAMSGLTSQPCLGSLVEALADTDRDTGLDRKRSAASRSTTRRWAEVRRLRSRFPGRRVRGLPARDAGRAVHQPQGAGALARPRSALARGRAAYADVNMLFGDIVKVTPSSKVVGDWR